MEAAQTNPVTRRIAILREQWGVFRENPDARLLRWRVDPDTAKLVEAFVAMEADEGGEDEALMLVFEQPFEDPASYGRTLMSDFMEAFADEAETIEEFGFDPGWKPPKDSGERDAAWFAKAMMSLALSCAESAEVETVCLALTPEAIGDGEAWALWLGELVRSGLTPNVRVTVIDPSGAPMLDKLCEIEPERIVTEAPEIDSDAMVREIAFSAPGAGPGFGFRRHMVSMLTTTRSNPVAAQASGVQARAIALEHGWMSLAAFVQFASAGMLVSEGKAEEAAKTYRAAGDEAQEGDEPKELKEKLLLQSRLAEGAAYMSGQKHAEAARVFTEAAPLAAEADDKPVQIQCLQLASFCHEQDKQREPAWERGVEAMDVGETVEPDDREQTVLPYAALGLLRLAEKRPFKKLRGQVQARADKLLGKGWEDKIEPAPDDKKAKKKKKAKGGGSGS